jgi:hypothetical protein
VSEPAARRFEKLGPDLENDLHRSDLIRDLVGDDSFAEELYAALCNVEWVKAGGEAGEPWSCTWRTSGGIVAELRDRGEEYIDFYLSGGEGHVTPRVGEALGLLGWAPLPDEDLPLDENMPVDKDTRALPD